MSSSVCGGAGMEKWRGPIGAVCLGEMSGATGSPCPLGTPRQRKSLNVGKTDGVMSRLMKKDLAPIMAAKWDRIIPCHGDVIETGGRAAWDSIWAKYA